MLPVSHSSHGPWFSSTGFKKYSLLSEVISVKWRHYDLISRGIIVSELCHSRVPMTDKVCSHFLSQVIEGTLY